VKIKDYPPFLLEFDGLQHFEAVDNWGGKEGLKDTQLRDKIKNNYCRDNHLYLVRIKDSKKYNNSRDKFKGFIQDELEEAGEILVKNMTLNDNGGWAPYVVYI
jgi:hypothetical protein